ncbi:hypothetical protein B0X78_14060 [bacterium AM6]|nr:hypothetical protein B0X78_14060 [bacterium AM6]
MRLRHATLYLLGMALIAFVFLPLDNQCAFRGWVSRFSAGPASAGQLNVLLFVWLPLLVLIAVCMLSLYRQVRRRDAGLLDEAGKRLLNDEMNWLLAFAGALAATTLVCRVAGQWWGVAAQAISDGSAGVLGLPSAQAIQQCGQVLFPLAVRPPTVTRGLGRSRILHRLFAQQRQRLAG